MSKSNKIYSKNSKKIYLDHASATPIDDSVLKFMQEFGEKYFANSSAIHEMGIESKKKLENFRLEVAQKLNAHSDEIIFTSGATESNNLAILGVVYSYRKKNKNIPHIITTNIEHASVLEVFKYLEKEKLAEVTFVPVEENGIVSPEKIRKTLQENTILISVMYANNEIGTIQPICDIAKMIRNFNKKNNTNIVFHTDATQAINYLPINTLHLGVNLFSFNGGKIYGPKGIGVLYIKRGVQIKNILFGGEQEFNLRPGTENLMNVAGLSRALEITEKLKEKELKRLTVLRDYFFAKLSKLPYEIKINGDKTNRLSNNVNITISKIPSDLLVIEFSAHGIYVSEKSACKSGDKKASHVIQALRDEENEGSLRFSFGRSTTKKDIDHTFKILENILTKLSKWYN